MNPKARYEALPMYDQRDTNGTEIRAVAGNFLFSTGANEFAGRYTAGHFDLPVMRTTITVDGTVVVQDGVLQDVFGEPSSWAVQRRAQRRRRARRIGSQAWPPACHRFETRAFGRAPQDEVESQHRRPGQPEVPQHRDERLQPLAPIGLHVEALVVEKARAGRAGRCGPPPCCARRSRARHSARCRARSVR